MLEPKSPMVWDADKGTWSLDSKAITEYMKEAPSSLSAPAAPYGTSYAITRQAMVSDDLTQYPTERALNIKLSVEDYENVRNALGKSQ